MSWDGAVTESDTKSLEGSWGQVNSDGATSAGHAGIDDLDGDGGAGVVVEDLDVLTASRWHEGRSQRSDEVGVLWLIAAGGEGWVVGVVVGGVAGSLATEHFVRSAVGVVETLWVSSDVVLVLWEWES